MRKVVFLWAAFFGFWVQADDRGSYQDPARELVSVKVQRTLNYSGYVEKSVGGQTFLQPQKISRPITVDSWAEVGRIAEEEREQSTKPTDSREGYHWVTTGMRDRGAGKWAQVWFLVPRVISQNGEVIAESADQNTTVQSRRNSNTTIRSGVDSRTTIRSGRDSYTTIEGEGDSYTTIRNRGRSHITVEGGTGTVIQHKD